MGFAWMEFKSRQERERDERDYLLRIFPKGREQKKAVEQELALRLPGMDRKGVMLYYVLIRDSMTGRDQESFEMASAVAMRRQHMVKVTPAVTAAVRAVMEENS